MKLSFLMIPLHAMQHDYHTMLMQVIGKHRWRAGILNLLIRSKFRLLSLFAQPAKAMLCGKAH